jgi:hypothetical protein
MIQFILTNIDTGLVEYVLHHSPDWAVPFLTVTGEPGHVFNWSMIDGSLIMDGSPLMTHTITIERIS